VLKVIAACRGSSGFVFSNSDDYAKDYIEDFEDCTENYSKELMKRDLKILHIWVDTYLTTWVLV